MGMIARIAKLACLCIDMGKQDNLLAILTAYILADYYSSKLIKKWADDQERQFQHLFGLDKQ